MLHLQRKTLNLPTPLSRNSSTFSPSMSSPSFSLLDAAAEMDMDMADSNSLTNSPSSNYKATTPNPNDGMDHFDHEQVSLFERRGYEFSEELLHLHDAVRASDLQLVNKILKQSSELHVLINEASENGRSALHVAVLSSNLKIARILIANAAIVNSQDFDGETPLHLSQGAPMTKLLLDEGRANPNIPNIDGICVLHLAVERRDVGAVRALLQHGAKVNTADNIRWFTPLHLSALPDRNDKVTNLEGRMRARSMITNMLCSASGSPEDDLNDQDNEKNTPLHYAVQIETEEACDVINSFLEKGADPKIANSREQHPLLLLCHNDGLRKHDVFQECLHSVLYAGADPNQQTMTGCTALHLSLYHRDIDSAVQLVNQAAELHLIWNKVSMVGPA
jgi:ankyrin repeat protein